MTMGIGGLVDFMTELGFELPVIAGVVAALDDSREQVSGARELEEVATTSFGDLPEGFELAAHTAKARVKVREALQDMMVGLEGYRDAIGGLVTETLQVEDDLTASLQRIDRARDCVDVTSFPAAGQCTPEG